MNNEIADTFIPLVALDDGSGNIACAYQDAEGKTHEFYQPSVVELGAAAGIGASNMSASIWETEGKRRYTVRKNPVTQISTLDPKYQLSEANRVLVADTLVKAKLAGSYCAVGCTLPAEQFYNRGDSITPVAHDRIKAKILNIQGEVKNVFGGQAAPIILHVSVYPEAIPAYYYCADPSREGADPTAEYPEEHQTLVVDLGEFTDDLAIIATNDEIVDFATHENGIHKMVQHFHTLLIREGEAFGLTDAKNMQAVDLKSIISRGYIGTPLNSPGAIAARVDVSHLIEESAQYLNELLLADIHALCRGRMASLTRIVFVGGGANWLGHLAKDWFHTVDIPMHPELAICRGVHLLLKSNRTAILKRAKTALTKLNNKETAE